MSDCDKKQLKYDLQLYWKRGSNDWGKYPEYIKNILPREMACVATDDDPKRLPDNRCETLVFLVGFSLEPLFQSVWAYQPERVLLILSEWYGRQPGEDRGEQIQELLQELRELLREHLDPEATVPALEVVPLPPLEDTSPGAVFKRLQHEIKQPNVQPQNGVHPVVIDITGSKKSMVAGAFLFAAYAGVPISYVDFDDDAYDPDRGRPYGYACRIGEIANPYRDFALRDWERVRTLYSRYNFQGARQVLEDSIIPAMEGILPDKVSDVKKLINILQCYERWDNGDFVGAYQLAQAMENFTPPTAVQILGQNEYWPHGHESGGLLSKLKNIEFGEDGVSDSIYLSPNKLLAYAYDEIARAKRLIKYNEDFRSALLKSVSLWEVLLRARVIGLWHADKLEASLDRKEYFLKSQMPENLIYIETGVYYGIICTPTGGRLESALKYDETGNSKAKGKHAKIVCYLDQSNIPIEICNKTGPVTDQPFFIRRASTSPSLADNTAMGRYEELRHKAIHTYLSVSEPIAREVYEIAENNVKDYQSTWLPAIWPEHKPQPINAQALSWPELCNLCGLDFLPANLSQNEPETEATA